MAAKTYARCDEISAWKELQQHFDSAGHDFDARTALATDPGRFAALSQQAPHVFADLSKNRTDAGTEALLLKLARQCGLEAQRDAMFAGEAINATENRAVMHFLLRQPAGGPSAPVPLAAQLQQVHATLQAMLAYAEEVRADSAITDVVNIGIGGSDLGPQMAVLALQEFAARGRRYHFVSNVDGHELDTVLKDLRPESTLFLIASKTFTTVETMTNARSARRWFMANGGTAAAVRSADAPHVSRHFAALTTNVVAAAEFGISRTFGFWDWVGGRYSLWSAIGLSIAIAIGAEGFRALLAGAHAMDKHFATAPLEQNLPVRLALLDIWYRNFHGFTSRNVAPYHSALRRLPAYLQQLEMESNGKRVDRQGRALPFATSPVVWGEPGTNGQHAYFQMLHQGTDVVPVEFIAVKTPAHELADHHPQLLANALAQAQALLQGSADAGPPQGGTTPSGGSEPRAARSMAVHGSDAGGHKDFPGNRPSTFLLLDRLDPASLGALIALYEHRVFSAGALWGINSFDQWGVELGKVLARDIAPRLESGDVSGLDASTAGLLGRLRG